MDRKPQPSRGIFLPSLTCAAASCAPWVMFSPFFVTFLVRTGAWASLCCLGWGLDASSTGWGTQEETGRMLGGERSPSTTPWAGRSMAKAPSPLCHRGSSVPQPSQGRPTLEELSALLKWRPIFQLPGSSGCAARCQHVPAPSWKLYLHNLLLTALRLPCCSDGLHGLTLKLLLPSPPSPFSAVGADWTVNIFCTTDLSKPLMI